MNAGQAITDAMREQRGRDLYRMAWSQYPIADRQWLRTLARLTLMSCRQLRGRKL